MTITRNPKRKAAAPSRKNEAKAAKFIAGANGNASTTMPRVQRDLVPVLINFERELLIQINQAAVGAGSTRSAWIIGVLTDRLRQLEE